MGVIRGALAILLGAFFLSMMGGLSKLGSGDLASTSLNFYRGSLGIVLLFIGSLFLPYTLRSGNFPLLVLRGILGGIAAVLFFYNIQKGIPLATAYLLLYTYPIFASIFAWIFLGERLEIGEIAAVLVSFGGIAVIFLSEWGALTLEHLFALLVGVFGGASVTTIRLLRKNHNPFIIYFYFCLAFVATGLVSGLSLPKGDDIYVVLVFAVIGLAGHIFLSYGFKYLETARGSVLAMTEVILASLWGLLFFQESPSIELFAGGVLVLGAGIYLTLLRVRQEKVRPRYGT